MATNILRPVVVGLDVHKDTIMACVFDPSSGEVGMARQFKNAPDGIARFVRTLRRSGLEPEVCYEASSCGYVIYRQLRALGVDCAVIAPTSIPRRAGERIKTDRRDAEKLATMYAGGLLETVEVPDVERVRALSPHARRRPHALQAPHDASSGGARSCLSRRTELDSEVLGLAESDHAGGRRSDGPSCLDREDSLSGRPDRGR